MNRAIMADSPVRALTTTLDEARGLGAMALFGEKYGDVVRMVEVGDGGWSRELCGGTHVRSTGVIGVLKVTTETSSAANVRRIEAITGEPAIEQLRRHDRVLAEAAKVLRTGPEDVADVAAERERQRRELEKQSQKATPIDDRLDPDAVVELDGVRVLLDIREVANPKALPDLADRLKNQLGDPAVVVLGAPGEGRASLLVAATPGAVERGVKAGAVVKAAAQVVGGGGGGRDNMAQAGGRDPDKLPAALDAARDAIRAAARRLRVLALDYGSARCGAAVSDPSGTLATPLEPVLRPGTRKGFARVVALAAELGAERIVVGLPLSLGGGDSAQTRETRAFAERLRGRRRRSGRALRRAFHDAPGGRRGRVGVARLASRGGSARRMAERPALTCR